MAQIATIGENQPRQTYADGRKILARRNVRDRPHRRCSTGPTQTPLAALLPSKGLKYVIPQIIPFGITVRFSLRLEICAGLTTFRELTHFAPPRRAWVN